MLDDEEAYDMGRWWQTVSKCTEDRRRIRTKQLSHKSCALRVEQIIQYQSYYAITTTLLDPDRHTSLWLQHGRVLAV